MSEALQTFNEDDEQKVSTKLLGAHVGEDIYWKFKGEAAKRKESMAEAITHAALMYIEAEEAGDNND